MAPIKKTTAPKKVAKKAAPAKKAAKVRLPRGGIRSLARVCNRPSAATLRREIQLCFSFA